MRDATRGGVATILNEVARAADVAVVVDEDAIPVRTGGARSRPSCSASTRCTWRARDGSWPLWTVPRRTGRWRPCVVIRSATRSAVIGRVRADPPGLVLLNTAFGGTRICDLLVGDPLPRIC